MKKFISIALTVLAVNVRGANGDIIQGALMDSVQGVLEHSLQIPLSASIKRMSDTYGPADPEPATKHSSLYWTYDNLDLISGYKLYVVTNSPTPGAAPINYKTYFVPVSTNHEVYVSFSQFLGGEENGVYGAYVTAVGREDLFDISLAESAPTETITVFWYSRPPKPSMPVMSVSTNLVSNSSVVRFFASTDTNSTTTALARNSERDMVYWGPLISDQQSEPPLPPTQSDETNQVYGIVAGKVPPPLPGSLAEVAQGLRDSLEKLNKTVKSLQEEVELLKVEREMNGWCINGVPATNGGLSTNKLIQIPHAWSPADGLPKVPITSTNVVR